MFCRVFSLLALWLGVASATPGLAAAQGIDDFNPGVNNGIHAVAVEPTGSLILAGSFTAIGGGGSGSVVRMRIARVSQSGAVDPAFNPGANGIVRGAAILPATGQILVVGEFTALGGGTGTVSRNRIGLINADGSIDSQFNPGANGAINALAIQPDGKVLVGGAFTAVGGGGTGSTSRSRIARLNTDGSVDGSFDPGANAIVTILAMGSLQEIYVAGTFTALGGGTGMTPRQGIGRLEPDGSVHAFAPTVDGPIGALAAEPAGGVLVGGTFQVVNGTLRPRLVRIDGDTGDLDPTFGPDPDGAVHVLALLANGQILVGGEFAEIAGSTRESVARLNADGSIDPTVNLTVDVLLVSGFAPQRDGGVYVTGAFSQLGGLPRSAIGRLAVPATQSEHLVVASTVNWSMAVGAPPIVSADFAWSSDGVTYVPFGSDVGPTTVVSAPNPGLPAGANVRVRVRGLASTGGLFGSSHSVLQIEAPVQGRDMVENGGFSSAMDQWLTFDQPLGSGMTWNINAGVFQFQRSGSQAVVFQGTGLPVPAHHQVNASFRLANTEGVRKRISVLIHDADFTDLAVCTFWLPANAPFRSYAMVAHPTKDWRNATISFYAASVGTGGFYQLDDVAMASTGVIGTDTMCGDPLVPAANPGGVVGSELVSNGSFSSGLPPWQLFGQISGSVTSGEFRFTRVDGTPSGVVLQPTGAPMAANRLMVASFQLGNVAGHRVRTTVLVHDLLFGDLAACTFWLEPLQPLKSYFIHTYATEAWPNATVSVYPATTVPAQVMRLDNVSLRANDVLASTGTECLSSGPPSDARRGETLAPPPVTTPLARPRGARGVFRQAAPLPR